MILQRIQNIEIDDDKRNEAEAAEQKARQVLSQVNDFSVPRNNTAKNLETTKKNVEKLLSKLEELQSFIEEAHSLILKASNDNQSDKWVFLDLGWFRNTEVPIWYVFRKAKLVEKIDTLEAAAKEAKEVIDDATKLVENVTQTLNKSKPSYEELCKFLVKLKRNSNRRRICILDCSSFSQLKISLNWKQPKKKLVRACKRYQTV